MYAHLLGLFLFCVNLCLPAWSFAWDYIGELEGKISVLGCLLVVLGTPMHGYNVFILKGFPWSEYDTNFSQRDVYNMILNFVISCLIDKRFRQRSLICSTCHDGCERTHMFVFSMNVNFYLVTLIHCGPLATFPPLALCMNRRQTQRIISARKTDPLTPVILTPIALHRGLFH